MRRKKLPAVHFSGKYALEIKDNVLPIPKRFGRSHLSKKLFLMGIDRRYIQIIPEEVFKDRCLGIIDGWFDETPWEWDVYFGGATQLDRYNRIHIPSKLLRLAGIGKANFEVFVIGQINILEVWNRQRWIESTDIRHWSANQIDQAKGQLRRYGL